MTKERELSEKLYPVGTRIRLESMTDPQPILPGECGTVDSIDDIGTLHMRWDNGRSLGLVPGEDSFAVIGKEEGGVA